MIPNSNNGFASLQITPAEAHTLAAEAEAQQRAESPSKLGSTARVIDGVARVTVRSATDANGETGPLITQEIIGTTRASGREAPPSGDAPFFHSEGGRPLLREEVGPRSLVTINGITSDLRSMINAGLLRQNADGTFSSANGTPAVTAVSHSDHQAQQPTEQPQQSEAPNIEPLADQEAEGIMTDAVSKMSHGLANATLTELIASDGTLSPTTTEHVASALGVTPEEASARIGKVVAAFEQQAHATLGSNHAAILEYARAHQPQVLRDAMMRQARDGTTAGYRDLVRSFTENLATYNPAALLATDFAKANGARQERNGEITVEVPGMGRVGWKAAIRTGLISPKV